MFRPKEDKDDVTKVHMEPPKALVTSCKQIVECLVRHILQLEENQPEQGQGSKGNIYSPVLCSKKGEGGGGGQG